MHYVNSSAICAVDWIERPVGLLVIFTTSTTVYTYHGVPKSLFLGLLSAASKGTYFNAHIRDKYPCSH